MNMKSTLFGSILLAFGTFLRIEKITISYVNDMGYVLQKGDVTMNFNKNIIHVTMQD